MIILYKVTQILEVSASMFWEVLWPLILGFALSAVVQSVVSHQSVAKALGKDSPKSISLAALLGCASSSCSYAAVALAKTLFKKGASFTCAMVFEIASTNLVIELGIILWVLLGWQFALSEYLGGIIMVILLALILRLTLTKKIVESARLNLQKGLVGKMEGHAQMDMSIQGGSLFSRIFSGKGFTAISHYFVMDWFSIWSDLALGFLIAGALAILIPHSFWQEFFLSSHPSLAKIEGPLVGPIVAILSFVCSVGNVPLAAVLWSGGISFGGVVSFIFADLIILPILNIYRKYYGLKAMGYILVTFYLTMALAGFIVEVLFEFLGLIHARESTPLVQAGIVLNYTTILNILFLIIGLALLIRFFKTKGLEMLKMM